jgi:hypothetical protein
MDFATVSKIALELGVIPTVALFLVVSMHLQNKKLTSMLEKHEQSTFEILKELVSQIAEYRTQHTKGGR